MKKYRIEFERTGCIGARVCAVADPKHFEMATDRFAKLIHSKLVDEKTGKYVLEVEAQPRDLEKMRMAAQGCPARVIYIYDCETGYRIY